MKVDHEDLGKLTHRITVAIDKEGFDKERRRLARKYAAQVRVPGFRPGMAPMHLVLAQLGPRIEYEVRENLISQTFGDAIDQFKLKASTEPKFDLVRDEENALEYTAEIEVFPEVDVKDYLEVEVAGPFAPEVTEAQIMERIDGLRKSLSRFEDKGEGCVVEEGDMAETQVTLSLVSDGTVIKDAHSSRIMGGTDDEPVEGIGRQILGLAAGEEKTVQGRIGRITARGQKMDPDQAGDVRAVVKIEKIRARKMPELDNEFVKKHADVETVEEFHALLKKQLEEQRDSKLKEETEELILSRICENNPFEIGERTIERLADMAEKEARDRVLQQIPEEKRAELAKDFDLGVPREKSLEEARRNLTRSIILEAIADKEGIQVTEADIEAKLQETADAYGMPLPKIKAIFGQERLEQLGRQLRVGKTLDLLTRHAVVTPGAEGAVQAAAAPTAEDKPARKATRAKKTAEKQDPVEETAAPAEDAAPEAAKKPARKPAAKKAAAPKQD
ncbi:MAG TPA: trigger factor [Myxococcota bacterium]|nr:trigger factor [Myxococcota bacterium]HOA13525.1 trigger factor [Myxococcota bacterium]HOH77014.1 trigger factor [Myxococcota bacterium]HPV04257.1 trigger factor [Myxococcota bacterium]